MEKHYCLTAAKSAGLSQYTVYTNGGIREAIADVRSAVKQNASHGRECNCPNPDEKHPINQIIRDGVLL